MTQQISKKPTCYKDIVDRILHYGDFKSALEYLVYTLSSKTSTSIIIRGDQGIGKTSLVKEAIAACDVISIRLRPNHFTDDFSALKYIATQLKLSPKLLLQEVLEDIEERCLKTDKKIVIILPQFEEFCRQKQSLLYCLTHLTQHGDNISLIGLTLSLDCTEHLEKRVRSRMNALFYELKPPYKDMKEYVEFASLLLGGHKIDKRLKEDLEDMYSTGIRSIRALKRHLVKVCSFDGKGKLIVSQQPVELPSQDSMHLLEERVLYLTRPQLELLKMIMYYCYVNQTNEFTLLELDEFAKNHNYNNFSSTSGSAIGCACFLSKNCLLRMHKQSQKMADRHSLFTTNLLPVHFKAVMEKYPELHSIKTDVLWKKLR